ncbi:MAG: 3-dehydroquinate synthase [Hungatella sp.]|nr:3-dehydroquinate synthase [Hungatella sp.]
MQKTLTVCGNGEPIYDIVLDTAFDGLGSRLEALGVRGRRVCVVTDSRVASLYLDQVRDILKAYCRQVVAYIFPDGEESKTLDTVEGLYEVLMENRFDRKDWLVALGGGVVGDLCGFGAATYLRGVSFIQIPTTLLAQVDSSIGGKTGVDVSSYKNMVGAFYMPRLVYTNVSTLLTLSDEQFSSGMGEVIKHGLIQDKAYYQWLLRNKDAIGRRELSVCMEMIAGSDEIKRRVVEQDPTEQGLRALLNFGHTLGHALEKQLSFSMLHGHCVGLGCLGAVRLSILKGYLDEDCLLGLRSLMESLGMPVKVEEILKENVVEDTKSDKKMDGDAIRFILLRSVGEAFVDRTVTEEDMMAALDEILL